MRLITIYVASLTIVAVYVLIMLLSQDNSSHIKQAERDEGETEESLLALEIFTNESLSDIPCDVPPSGYQGWNNGVVTVVTPKIYVNCSKVISGDEEEVERIKNATTHWKKDVTDEDVLQRVQNCSWLRDHFSHNLYVSKMEMEFPIAFTFVVYDSPQQVLRLLRLLYRPQNSYCIHTDIKSPHKIFFHSIAKCFSNVIIPSVEVDVVWGYYTILEAQMNCMKDLLALRKKQRQPWMYVINLCGKELPLITQKELVTRLIRLNGSSSVIASMINNKTRERIKYPVTLNQAGTEMFVNRKSQLEDPPFPLSLFGKSSSYNAISLSFAMYLMFNPKAQEIYDFLKKCQNPEEHFYAILYNTPGVPGGRSETVPKSHYFKVAAALWSKWPEDRCQGEAVHNVCIISAGDLVGVVKETHKSLFFNKYFMDNDHTVMTCMEERIVTQNKMEYLEECSYS